MHESSSTLITAGSEVEKNGVTLYSITDGSVRATLRGHRGPVRCVACDGDVLASGGDDGQIILWSLVTGGCMGVLTTDSTPHAIHGLAMKGDILVSGGYDRAVRIWSVSRKRPTCVMQEHKGAVSSVSLVGSHNSKVLVSASMDKTAKVWPTRGHYKSLHTMNHPGVVYSVSCGTGQLAATGCADGKVRLWSLTTFVCMRTLWHGMDRVRSVRCIGSNLVVSGGRDERVKLWSLKHPEGDVNECLGTLELGANVAGVALSQHGYIASVGYGGVGLRVCKLKRLDELQHVSMPLHELQHFHSTPASPASTGVTTPIATPPNSAGSRGSLSKRGSSFGFAASTKSMTNRYAPSKTLAEGSKTYGL